MPTADRPLSLIERPRLRWVLLFIGLILVPVSLLTYQSIQSLKDEREGVAAEQQLLASLLQEAAAQLFDDITRNVAYAESGDADLAVYESVAEVAQAFAADDGGALLHPLTVPMRLGRRSPDFARTLAAAERLEFAAADYPAAVEAYWRAWEAARSDAENAEALNALGRCALRAGDVDIAADIHRKLTFYNLSFDADGAHAATLSHLRLARALGGDEGAAVLAEWVRGTLDGYYPLYPGSGQAVRDARSLAADWGRPALTADLARIDRRIEFSRRFAASLAGRIGPETAYVAGRYDDGTSYLLYARPLDDGRALGLLFDLEQLRATLARSAAGQRFGDRGYEFELFAREGEREFAARHEGTIHLVRPLGRAVADLRLGVFARDPRSAVDSHRKRNLALLTGLLALVGCVAFGGYAIFRDASRQLDTARLRSDFVANVSHELRTPLTAIRLNAETLLAGRYPSEHKREELLKRVLRESERLGRLVDNVLAFSRIESGRARYDFAPCDLAEIARAALDAYAAPLDQLGFAVTARLPQGLPPLAADREAVLTATSNLIGNAMKYSGDSREIELEVRRAEGGLVLQVADRGIGVPPAERERIFDKFYRASNTAAQAAAGTGVGLALVWGIAAAHGGRVEMEPREGGGSLFRLVLPPAEETA